MTRRRSCETLSKQQQQRGARRTSTSPPWTCGPFLPEHGDFKRRYQMFSSRRAVTLRWMFVTLLGFCYLQTGVGIDELVDCTPYQCCLDECCGPDTSWDDSIEYCVPDPGASGYIAIFKPEYVPVCAIRTCCEDLCCFPGTYYEPTIQGCLPLSIPTEAPVAPTPAPAPDSGSADMATDAPTQVVILPFIAPAFRPNVCGSTMEDAAALCSNTTTCNQAKDGEDCYEPCSVVDQPSGCPDGQVCWSFVGGCKDFAPDFPGVPFDPSIFP
jgi:hypothetical protein